MSTLYVFINTGEFDDENIKMFQKRFMSFIILLFVNSRCRNICHSCSKIFLVVKREKS